MAITVQDLINGVRMTQLDDPEATTWPDDVMIIALNQALSMLALMRPDSTSTIGIINLTKGSRQFLPADGLRLLRVIRNVTWNGDPGTDPVIGRAVRIIQMEALDSMSPDWHNTPATTAIHEYCFDARNPKHFYVYPSPPTAGALQLEIEYSKEPPQLSIVDMASDLPVDLIYMQPLQELMLYKLLSGDSRNGGVNGMPHLNTATSVLGIKASSEEASSPARKTQA